MHPKYSKRAIQNGINPDSTKMQIHRFSRVQVSGSLGFESSDREAAVRLTRVVTVDLHCGHSNCTGVLLNAIGAAAGGNGTRTASVHIAGESVSSGGAEGEGSEGISGCWSGGGSIIRGFLRRKFPHPGLIIRPDFTIYQLYA